MKIPKHIYESKIKADLSTPTKDKDRFNCAQLTLSSKENRSYCSLSRFFTLKNIGHFRLDCVGASCRIFAYESCRWYSDEELCFIARMYFRRRMLTEANSLLEKQLSKKLCSRFRKWGRITHQTRMFSHNKNALVIQRAFRKNKSRLTTRRKAARRIQCFYRVVNALHAIKLKKLYIKAYRDASACQLHKWWRCMKFRRKFCKLRKASITIQKWVKQTHFQNELDAMQGVAQKFVNAFKNDNLHEIAKDYYDIEAKSKVANIDVIKQDMHAHCLAMKNLESQFIRNRRIAEISLWHTLKDYRNYLECICCSEDVSPRHMFSCESCGETSICLSCHKQLLKNTRTNITLNAFKCTSCRRPLYSKTGTLAHEYELCRNINRLLFEYFLQCYPQLRRGTPDLPYVKSWLHATNLLEDLRITPLQCDIEIRALCLYKVVLRLFNNGLWYAGVVVDINELLEFKIDYFDGELKLFKLQKYHTMLPFHVTDITIFISNKVPKIPIEMRKTSLRWVFMTTKHQQFNYLDQILRQKHQVKTCHTCDKPCLVEKGAICQVEIEKERFYCSEHSACTFQECPHCNVMTERIDGCNYVVCKNNSCRGSWCFLCRKKLTPRDHDQILGDDGKFRVQPDGHCHDKKYPRGEHDFLFGNSCPNFRL